MKKITIFFISILISTYIFAQNSNNDAQTYSKALMLKSQKKYNEAVVEFKKLETSQIDKYSLYLQLAECYFILNDLTESISYCDKGIEKKPDSPEIYNIKIQAYYKLNQFDKAADTAEQILFYKDDLAEFHYYAAYLYHINVKNYVLSAYHSNKVLEISQVNQYISPLLKEKMHIMLAESYYNLKNYEKCLFHLGYLASYNQNNNSKVLSLTEQFFKEDKYQNAIDGLNIIFKNLSQQQQRTKTVYNLASIQGRLLYIAENHNSSEYLRKGINSGGYSALLCKGLFNEQINKNDEAKKILTNIIQKDSKVISAQLGLAKIYEKENDPDKAYSHYVAAGLELLKTDMHSANLNIFKKAAKIKPESKEIQFYISDLYDRMGKYSLAVYYFKKSIPDDINDVKSDQLLHLGYLYHLNKDLPNSLKYIKMAMKAEPENDRAYFLQSIVQLDEKKYTDSIKSLNQALEYNKTNDTYMFYIAINYEELQKIDKTIEFIEKAISHNGNNPTYQNYLGYTYAVKNMNLDKAETLIVEALKTNPFNGAYLDSLGWVYYKRGELNKALTYLLRAKYNLLASDEMDPDIYDHLGETYLKLGDKDMAKFYWEEYLKIDKNEEINLKLNKLKSE